MFDEMYEEVIDDYDFLTGSKWNYCWVLFHIFILLFFGIFLLRHFLISIMAECPSIMFFCPIHVKLFIVLLWYSAFSFIALEFVCLHVQIILFNVYSYFFVDPSNNVFYVCISTCTQTISRFLFSWELSHVCVCIYIDIYIGIYSMFNVKLFV